MALYYVRLTFCESASYHRAHSSLKKPSANALLWVPALRQPSPRLRDGRMSHLTQPPHMTQNSAQSQRMPALSMHTASTLGDRRFVKSKLKLNQCEKREIPECCVI